MFLLLPKIRPKGLSPIVNKIKIQKTGKCSLHQISSASCTQICWYGATRRKHTQKRSIVTSVRRWPFHRHTVRSSARRCGPGPRGGAPWGTIAPSPPGVRWVHSDLVSKNEGTSHTHSNECVNSAREWGRRICSNEWGMCINHPIKMTYKLNCRPFELPIVHVFTIFPRNYRSAKSLITNAFNPRWKAFRTFSKQTHGPIRPWPPHHRFRVFRRRGCAPQTRHGERRPGLRRCGAHKSEGESSTDEAFRLETRK